MRWTTWIVGAAACLALGACADRTTAPAADGRGSPQFGIAGGDSAGLAWRSDSLTRSAYVQWEDANGQGFLSVSEGMVGGQRVALVGYGVLAPSPCWWDPSQICYDVLSWGWGNVDPKDVHAGSGALSVTTNTAPDVNPGFMHYNDPGGVVSLTVNQVPGSASQLHQNGGFTWENQVVHYNVLDERRAATAAGSLEGVPLPPTATAILGLSWGHTTVRFTP